MSTTTSPSPSQAAPQPTRPRRHRTTAIKAAVSSILGGLVSFILVVLVGFFLFRMLPGDPVTTMSREMNLDGSQRAALRESLGLNDPMIVQFGNYLIGVVQGDLGQSFEYKQPVSQLISERIGATLLLTGVSMVLAVALGLPIGTRAGWRRGSVFDKLSVGVSLTLWSVPTFWLALLLLMTLGVGVGPLPGLFPVNGMQSSDVTGGWFTHALDIAWHMVLPVITIVAVIYAQYVLVMRSSVLDEIGNDYLNTARAKGLRDALVLRRHAVPNALLPTVTVIMIQVGFLVTGAITTEYVFSWPGLGSLTAEALNIPDLPLLQGTFIVFSGCVIIANVVADLLYLVIDPRLRNR
jgi:peptide/nickel transport system permease protein